MRRGFAVVASGATDVTPYGSWAQWRKRLAALPNGGTSYVTCSAHPVARTCGCIPQSEHELWTKRLGFEYDAITIEAAGRVTATR